MRARPLTERDAGGRVRSAAVPRLLRAAVALSLVAAVASCSGSGSDSKPAAAAAKPVTIVAATVADHPVSAISAVLTVETKEPASISAHVDGPGDGFDIPPDAAATK